METGNKLENSEEYIAPLVTVLVVTYNSSKFILETLESTKAQTYKNIEIIVSDDGSTDETVAICKAWVQENEERFINSKIITVKKNTGIPANCNRGVNASSGQWIKLLAGDDTLMPNCIADNVEFVHGNPEIEYVQSKMNTYREHFTKECFEKVVSKEEYLNASHSITAKNQYQLILLRCVVAIQTGFFTRALMLRIPFDESLPFLEDGPMVCNITKNGTKIHFMDKITFNYRLNPNSISHSSKSSKKTIFSDWYKKGFIYQKKYIIPYLSNYPIVKFSLYYYYFIHEVMNYFGLNKITIMNRIIYRMLREPFILMERIRIYQVKKYLEKNIEIVHN